MFCKIRKMKKTKFQTMEERFKHENPLEVRIKKAAGYREAHPGKIPIILSTMEQNKQDFFNGYK